MPTRKNSRKVMILCHGLPSIPKKNKVLEYYSKKGYWVFFPRYRGSWESDGAFLEQSPHQDVLDIIDQLPKGFTEFWTGKKMRVQPSVIHLLGSSFGGAAVLLASQDKRVDKVIAISPVVDWTDDSKVEPLDWLGKFTKNAFGNAYRFKQSDWDKLARGKFYNPMQVVHQIDGAKILIIHAKNDDLASYRSAQKFAEETGASLWTLRNQGHLSTSIAIEDKFSSRITKFLQSERPAM